jgi:transmembrane sensor
MAAVAGVAVVYPPLGLWPSASEWDADYRTAAGEQRTLALAPQVDLTLNTRTSVRRRIADGQTVGVELIAGEAAVDLKGAGRPFTVVAGAGRNLAEAGQFEVRYLANKVCVTCIEGALRVEHPAGTRALQAGQQAIYDARNVSDVAEINSAEVSAWRKGVLVFRQARLADVVDEINRYRSGRVVLMRADIRNKEVTGHFEIASLDRALTQLQYMFDLHAKSLVGGVLLLS